MLSNVAEAPRSAISTTRFYRPELDVLRFAAFFMVLLSHTMPNGLAFYEGWSGSAAVRFALDRVRATSIYGLPLFFCLSAYLIASLLLREREVAGTICLKDFYVRRVLRIWPLYLVALLAGLFRGMPITPKGTQRFCRSCFWRATGIARFITIL